MTGTVSLVGLAAFLLAGCATLRPTEVRIDPGGRAEYNDDLLACWNTTDEGSWTTPAARVATLLFGVVGMAVTYDGAQTERIRSAHERRAEACMESRGYTVTR